MKYRLPLSVTGAAGTVVVDAAVERDRDRALRGRRRAGRNVAEREDRAAVRHAERIHRLGAKLGLDYSKLRLNIGSKNMIIFIKFAARIDFIYKPLLIHNCPP